MEKPTTGPSARLLKMGSSTTVRPPMAESNAWDRREPLFREIGGLRRVRSGRRRSALTRLGHSRSLRALVVIRKSLSCEPGESYERSASLRLASDSAAAYGQIR